MKLADGLSLCCCPESGSKLQLADTDLVHRLNQQIAAGRLRNRSDRVIDRPLDGGLVREGGDILYPIRDGIPVLLKDEGIAIDSNG